MGNVTPYIPTYQSGFYNLRSDSEFHSGFDHLIIGRLNKGLIFWSGDSAFPNDIVTASINDCQWTDMGWGFPDVHDFYYYYPVRGFFNRRQESYGYIARTRHRQSGNRDCYRHAQHANHDINHYINSCNARSATLAGQYLLDRFMKFIDWVWTNTGAGNTQNFARRHAVDLGGREVTLLGCRVLRANTPVVNLDGTHHRLLNINDWVWFSYGNPPVTGATNKRRLRIVAWSVGAWGSLSWGSWFADWGLDLPVDTQTGHQYRIATLPTTTW
jgi:hypothetical protein